jgi:hypothetical protein
MQTIRKRPRRERDVIGGSVFDKLFVFSFTIVKLLYARALCTHTYNAQYNDYAAAPVAQS